MKIEPTMFSQIVNCFDQLLEVYEFNINAATCTPFNASIIRCALSSKIDQLKSLRKLFIKLYNEDYLNADEEENKEKRSISLVCDRCGQPFKLNVIFDKNGECNSILSRLCSKCINSLNDEKQKGVAPDAE